MGISFAKGQIPVCWSSEPRSEVKSQPQGAAAQARLASGQDSEVAFEVTIKHGGFTVGAWNGARAATVLM